MLLTIERPLLPNFWSARFYTPRSAKLLPNIEGREKILSCAASLDKRFPKTHRKRSEKPPGESDKRADGADEKRPRAIAPVHGMMPSGQAYRTKNAARRRARFGAYAVDGSPPSRSFLLGQHEQPAPRCVDTDMRER